MDCDYPVVVLDEFKAPRFVEMVTSDMKILIPGILQPAEAVQTKLGRHDFLAIGPVLGSIPPA